MSHVFNVFGGFSRCIMTFANGTGSRLIGLQHDNQLKEIMVGVGIPNP